MMYALLAANGTGIADVGAVRVTSAWLKIQCLIVLQMLIGFRPPQYQQYHVMRSWGYSGLPPTVLFLTTSIASMAD
jgi:hypothetical protein